MTSEATRPLTRADADAILPLYADLIQSETPPDRATAMARLDKILSHDGTTLHGALRDGAVVAMCTLHILPNMTRGGRPYALIENVVTAADARRRGHARRAMQSAIDAAWAAGCYKVMLLSGSADGHAFYPRLGFDGDAKRGFILRRP